MGCAGRLGAQGKSEVEGLAVVSRTRAKPQTIHAVVGGTATRVVQVFVVGVVCCPPRTIHAGKGLERRFHATDNVGHDIRRAGGQVSIDRTLDTQQHLDILAQVARVDLPAREHAVLIRSRFKLSVRGVHDLSHLFQIALAVASVTNPEQLAHTGAMGRSEGIRTDHADRGEADADSRCTIVRVAQEEKLAHLVAVHDLRAVAVEFRQHPDLLPTVERAGSVKVHLVRVDERLEPIERGGVLERHVAGTDHAQNRTVTLTNRSTSRNALAAPGEQITQTDRPVEPGSEDSLTDGRSRLQTLTQTVPRGFLDVEHGFDSVSHSRNLQNPDRPAMHVAPRHGNTIDVFDFVLGLSPITRIIFSILFLGEGAHIDTSAFLKDIGKPI